MNARRPGALPFPLLVAARLAIAVALAAWAVSARAQDAGGAPRMEVQARLVPAGPVPLRATVLLEVDVLSSTWFAEPPDMPGLHVPDAVTAGPVGRARGFRASLDGQAYTALRYTYLVSPTKDGELVIPSLDVAAQLGQADGVRRARTAAVSLAVRPLAGGGPEPLVATAVQASQSISYSAKPLRVGDRITRQVDVRADGAQGILIPAVDFPDIAGMRRYAGPHGVQTVLDAHGDFAGGSRHDQVDYVVEQAGDYRLPDIDVGWWDAGTGRRRHTTLPGEAVHVQPNPDYRPPFDVRRDLAELRRAARFHLAVDGRALALVAAVVIVAAWLVARWRRPFAAWCSAYAGRLRQRWQASELHAWRAARRALGPRGAPDGLRRFYVWLRRARGAVTLDAATRDADPALRQAGRESLQHLYGARPDRSRDLDALRRVAVGLRRGLRRGRRRTRGRPLSPLNPGSVAARLPASGDFP